MRPIVHVEIASADNDEAKAFYNALLGWEAQDIPMGGDFTYTMFNTGVDMNVALSPLGDGMKPGDVILYFQSDDLDADMARVSELGGRVILPRQDVPGFGALGMFLDPTGNRRGQECRASAGLSMLAGLADGQSRPFSGCFLAGRDIPGRVPRQALANPTPGPPHSNGQG